MAKEKETVDEVVQVKAEKGIDLSNLSEAELKRIAQPERIPKIGEPQGPRNQTQMAAVIELYKRQNPAKFEVKKASLEAQLKALPK